MSTRPDNLAVPSHAPSWRDYLELTKPKVSLLIVFTAIVGMVLASPGMVPLPALVFGTLGIALASGSAAAFNHVLDRRIDEQMARTRRRPLPTGHLSTGHGPRHSRASLGAGVHAGAVADGGQRSRRSSRFVSLIGYAIVYTLWLKRATPQNIVIGGAAGAAPPVLGWAAVTNTIDPHALLLFLIIFTWTPPHFWALAIARRDDYAKVGIPMLPVTHGIPFTRLQIVLYTILLVFEHPAAGAHAHERADLSRRRPSLERALLYFVLTLNRERGERPQLPMQTFRFSITYLMLLFAALILDHYFLFLI